jgi:hypothetical protein
MTSIKMQTQIEVLEHQIVKLMHENNEFKQVVDALTSVVEKRAHEAEEDRAVVKKLMEHVGMLTLKGSVHGAGVRKQVSDGRKVTEKAPF